MYQELLQDASFFELLRRMDVDLAEETRLAGCPCGGVLHFARYRRKPRGGPAELSRECCLRESLCCSEEGCRRGAKPPSPSNPFVIFSSLGTFICHTSTMRPPSPEHLAGMPLQEIPIRPLFPSVWKPDLLTMEWIVGLTVVELVLQASADEESVVRCDGNVAPIEEPMHVGA